MSEYSKMLYRERKAHGICVECGLREAFYKRVRCPECLEKRTNYEHTQKRLEQKLKLQRERVAKRLANGLCVECGEPLSPNSKRWCEKHLLQHRKYSKVWEAKKRAENRVKSLDQIAQERSERGRKNIVIARNSPNFKANLNKQRKYWNKKYWSGNPHG